MRQGYIIFRVYQNFLGDLDIGLPINKLFGASYSTCYLKREFLFMFFSLETSKIDKPNVFFIYWFNLNELNYKGW